MEVGAGELWVYGGGIVGRVAVEADREFAVGDGQRRTAQVRAGGPRGAGNAGPYNETPRDPFVVAEMAMRNARDDPYELRRFVEAQEHCIDDVLRELGAGRKSSHWMWFVFPQIAGLGMSATARTFGIKSLQEAAAYLVHPVLGPRLRECAQLVMEVEGRSLREIFGSPDDLKFRSCMTLFAQATSDNQTFLDALKKYCGGAFDPLTMELLGEV